MACPHTTFTADVTITRIEEAIAGRVEGSGFLAEIRVTCAACGTPFRFLGLPAGLDLAHPMVSIEGETLLAPMEPADTPVLADTASYHLPQSVQSH